MAAESSNLLAGLAGDTDMQAYGALGVREGTTERYHPGPRIPEGQG